MSKKTKRSNKVGALAASAQISLHSVETLRLWNGGKGKAGVGLFFKSVATLEYAARQDDPYADFALLEIERKMNDAFSICQKGLAALPALSSSRIQFSEALSSAPVVKSVAVTTRFGWRLVALIEQFDVLMVRLSDAHFKAQMSRETFEAQRQAAAQALRAVLHQALSRPHSGITRQDVATNNAKAIKAQAELGAIPFEVLEGIERAEFAPEIR